MKKSLYPLLLLGAVLSTFHTVHAQCDRTADSLELVQMYNAWAGPEWTNTWDLSEPLDSFYGTTLNAQGCVTGLDLFKNNLQGEIFDINLPALSSLILSANYELGGSLPNFSQIPQIHTIKLYGTFVGGSLPDFTYIPNLREINLEFTQVSGQIPNFSNLPALQSFFISSNNLTDTIPDFTNLPNLRSLKIGGGNSTGTIPDFAYLPFLSTMSLVGNFSGDIPDFSNIPLLNSLEIGRVIGSIPDFSFIPNLRKLIVTGSGNLPDFSHIPEVSELRIGGFSGNLPDFSHLPQLKTIEVSDSEVSGNLPLFQHCPLLRQIFFSSTQLSGEIPNYQLPYLDVLEISSSRILGQLPNFDGLPNLKSLYLSDNHLIGRFPKIENCPGVEHIYAQNNNFSGPIPSFEFQNNLTSLYLYGNDFTGILPDFSNKPQLQRLALGENKLTGLIPTFTENPLLRELSLGSNLFDSCAFIDPSIRLGYAFSIGSNRLSLDDLLLNLPYASEYQYMFQQPVPSPKLIPVPSGGYYINLGIDQDVVGGRFQWYNRGSLPYFMGETETNQIFVETFNPQDSFIVYISHPDLPGLTEMSTPTFYIRDAYPVVKGRLVHDTNSNCIPEESEESLANWDVRMVGASTYYGRTNAQGEFHFVMDTGQYQLEVLLPNNQWSLCPGIYNIQVTYLDTLELSIPVQSFTFCPELQVNVGIQNPFYRRCFSNKYAIGYCNKGTAPEGNARVEFWLDEWIVLDSASVPIVHLGGGHYVSDIGNLDVGQCKTFSVYVSIDCDAPLNAVQCFRAHIYPDTLCNAPSGTWPGATMDVSGRCENDQAHLLFRNTGHQAPADSLEYRIYQNGVLVEAARYRLAAGDSLVFHRPGGNNAWRLETDQAPGHPCSVLPSVFVEGCGPGLPGQAVTSYALQFPDDSNCPFEDKVCFPITGSYDPNDKTAFPVGYGPDHLIEPGTDIEYLVRFQNVGNDTAFHVFVRDTLSAFLDPATVEVTGFSHPYQLNVDSTGALEFAFYHIHLTDTITDEPGSHGYIRFRVSQKSGNIIGAIIRNQAAIYFDFNAPIITNLVFHTLGVDFVPDALAPVWETPPADLVFNCHRNMDVDALIQQWLNNAGGALVSDHSMPITLSNDYTALSGGCNGFSGTATVTFTATDRWGNSSSSIATLSAMDTIPPVWEILPQSVEIACSEDLPTRLADWLLDNGGGEVSDACGTVAVTYAYELSGACTDSTLVTFIAVDECGNTAQIQAYFIVSNSLPPAITAPASDLILPCDAPDLPVRIQQWLLEHGGAQAEGACSSVSWRHVLGQPTPGCGNTSETSVTFIAEDACGNAASLSARIRLVDTVAPVWTAAPENLILYCGAATEATIQVWLQQAGGGAATDACSAIAMSYNYNGLSNGCNPQTGTATVVFTAEDACGNRSTRSAMIEVRDTTPPVWTQLPTPIVLQCGEDLWGAFLPWLANSGGGMVEDDCGTSSITYFYTEQVDCLDPDTLHVVFSGRDACGNVSEITIPVVVLRPTDIYNPAFEISSIRVFPNPARESVQIQWQGAENESFRLQLWNASGHVMTTVEGRGHALELSVAAYSSGVYFFAIETAGGKKGYGRVVRM